MLIVKRVWIRSRRLRACRHESYGLVHDKRACSMAEEFPELMPDISELDWANEAFGAAPEATNLWIGGTESATSFHKARVK